MDLVSFGPPSNLNIERRWNRKPSTLQKGQTREFNWIKSKLVVKLPGEDARGFDEILEWGSSSWCCIPDCADAELRSNEKVVEFSARVGDRILKSELRNSAPAFDDIKDIYITDHMDGVPLKHAVRAYFAYFSGTIDWDDVLSKPNESPADLKARCEKSGHGWDGEDDDEDDRYFRVSEPYRYYELENVECSLTIATF